MNGAFPFLTVLILLPAVGAIALALCGLDRRSTKEFSEVVAIGVSLATLGRRRRRPGSDEGQ